MHPPLHALYSLTLALNTLWFGAGFVQFCFKSRHMARGLVQRQDAQSPVLDKLAGVIRFLGGLNFSLSLMNLAVLLSPALFQQPAEQVLLLLCFTAAHASQFAVNVPIALRERRGTVSPWPVLRGLMLMIFAIDGLLMVVNIALAAVLWAHH